MRPRAATRLGPSPRLLAAVCGALLATLAQGVAWAQTPEVADTWRVQPGGPLMLDAGILASPAAALGPSLSTGVAAGVSRGGRIAWQVRASFSSATESSMAWTVTQAELRLRAGALIQRPLGRARIGLRVGLGPTVVHETRARNQSTLQTSDFATIPAGDLEVVLALHVWSRWLLVMSGGPDASESGGSLHAGWLGQLGVGWQP
jgi:hypothetical protein